MHMLGNYLRYLCAPCPGAGLGVVQLLQQEQLQLREKTNEPFYFITSLSNKMMQHMYHARGPAKVGDGTRPCVEWLVLLGSRMQVVKLP